MQLFQPYAEELIASGAGHVWYAAADRGLTAYTTLVTRRPLLQSRRDELLRMTRAIARTLRWIAATPGADIARALVGLLPRRRPRRSLPPRSTAIATLDLFAADPVLRREGFDRLQAAMRSGGALNRAIPFERCVDNSLAEQALADASAQR